MSVPQGPILGPIIFNIFLNDLLLSKREAELCNFADDNTIFAIAKTLHDVVAIHSPIYFLKTAKAIV